MNTSVMHYIALLALLSAGLLWAKPAQATITCSNTKMSALTFGNVDPQSSQTNGAAALTYTCRNSTGGGTYSATICFSIGEPFGGQTDPRLMNDGATPNHFLSFQLYKDASLTQPWGSTGFGTFRTPLLVNITLAAGVSQNYSASLFGQVRPGQTTAFPGSYSDNYQNGDTATSVSQQTGNTPPGTCGGDAGLVFPFLVTASVVKQCTVTAGPTLNLGDPSGVDATATNVAGSNSINVTCTTGTAYNVGLAPSNSSTTGAGLMSGTGSNTDKVAYQLRKAAGIGGAIWGNTATSNAVGNGIAGTGNGNGQTLMVYATAPSADFTPDTYTDTVTINVNY